MKIKQSQVSIQFNWILVLIIGAVILVFFITIVQKQKEHSEQSISGSIQTDLQAIFSSSYISTKTSSIVEIPDREIIFSCEGFKIGNQFAAKFPYAFAPSSIKSDRNTISLFAYDWNAPFRVTNFLYVTSPDIKYIIYENPSNPGSVKLAKAIEELLPEKNIIKEGKSNLFMNKERTSVLTEDMNNYKIKIIYFDKSFLPDFANKYPKKKDGISALYIESNCESSNKPLDCGGTLEFNNYDHNTGAWPYKYSDYFGKAGLLAAIFSENQEIYECGMKNAFERLQNIALIYQYRVNELKTYYKDKSCESLFDSSIATIDNIRNAAVSEDYNLISSESSKLESQNENILANSCPPIY